MSRLFSLFIVLSLAPTPVLSEVPPTGAAPSSGAHLLAAPPQPLSYFEAKERVRALVWSQEGSATELEQIAEQLVRDYPHDGENWDLLARIKSRLRKHEEAARAWEMAGPLIGWGMTRSPGFNAAQMYALSGDKRRALDLIWRQIYEVRSPLRFEMYDWPEFASLRDDPEFRELAGRPDTTDWTRDYGWRRDIEHLHAEVKRVNPEYHDAPPPAEFTRLRQVLWNNVPQLSDEEIFAGMNQMLATLDQGHTWLGGFPSEHRSGPKLPLRFYLFPEGLFIVAASDEHQELVGSEVVAFGDTPAVEALRRLRTVLSTESEMLHLYLAPGRSRNLGFLRGLGIVATEENIRLTVRPMDGAAQSVTVTPGEGTVSPNFNLLPAPSSVSTPLFLSNQAEKHWDRLLPEQDAVYVQLYNVHDEQDESLPEYGKRLRRLLAEVDPANLILDMRHNTGGATALYPELLRTIVGFSQRPGKQVYVIIGRATYSAAANLITDLERLADPIFLGEPSGQCCNFAGDPSPVLLPYSRVSGAVSAVRWNLSGNVFEGRSEISPEVPVQLTARAYFAGEDPVVAAISHLIRRRESPGVRQGGGLPPPDRPVQIRAISRDLRN